MKKLISYFTALFLLASASLEARISHQVNIKGCDTEIAVITPEGFSDNEIEDFDFCFFDPENQDRRVFFHCFDCDEFELNSFSDVFEYTDWLYGHIFSSVKRYRTSFSSAKEYAIRAFTTLDAQEQELYCYSYLGKVGGGLVFSVIATSSKSQEEAREDVFRFLSEISWQRR